MNKRTKLLIVDDLEINRTILSKLFENEYEILEASDGNEALQIMSERKNEIAAVLLDLYMPIRSGYEVLVEMRKRKLLDCMPVIVITSDSTVQNESKSFDLGASDIVPKPFEPYVVKHRVKNVIELNRYKLYLEELVESQSKKLRESNAVLIDTLSSVIEYRSLESGQHIKRIKLFTRILLEELATSCYEYGLDEKKINLIADASSLHDIGKIAVPDSILNKPGKLTEQEFEIMKLHTVSGCEMLLKLERMNDKEYLKYAYNVCRYHHERWDGKGYPEGLKGDNIPICAQVVSIADCYDALTTDRVYKAAIPHAKAMDMILNGECGTFSPTLLDMFLSVNTKFEKLSKEYVDTNKESNINERIELEISAPSREINENTSRQYQVNYQSLLRYTNSMVMEVDLNLGTYHIAHLADIDFKELQGHKKFDEAIKCFVQTSVHPDDSQFALELTHSHIDTFIENGLMRTGRRYRIKNLIKNEFEYLEETLLRVDMDNPKRKMVLLIMNKIADNSSQKVKNNAIESRYFELALNYLMGGVQKCKNDKWFTFVHINSSFLSLVGFTEDEIQTKYNGRFVEMIFVEDRERVVTDWHKQIAQNNALFELEYRLIDKGGNIKWVLDKSIIYEENGEEYVYCLIIDVTNLRRTHDEMRLLIERHNIIMNQTNHIIFEWDLINDVMEFSPNWKKVYGSENVIENFKKKNSINCYFHPEDEGLLLTLERDLLLGISYREIEIRVKKLDEKYCWCKMRTTGQADERGRVFKAVGVIIDVDDEIRLRRELIERAERDSLTKLYNKNTGKEKIEQAIATVDSAINSAMLVIDIDDFKYVNDYYGHMFGDAVLARAAESLMQLFGERAIVSRIGGDEFLVFLPYADDIKVAENMAARIIEKLRVELSGNLDDSNFSCSIGITIASGADKKYNEMFCNADYALYEAKSEGKNKYCVYDKKRDLDDSINFNRYSAVRTKIESDDSSRSMLEIVMQVFNKLYKTTDFDSAINSILQLIGQIFNVSRTYIFEEEIEGVSCKNTYEWCNIGIEPEINNLQSIDYAGNEDEDIRSHFDENNIFYCEDVRKLPIRQREILEPQGILSMLQCAIADGNKFKGFVGFDECNIMRLWTREQIDGLSFIAKLLSIFLLKKRAEDKTWNSMNDLKAILDCQESIIYVVDKKTFSLKYANKKTHSLVENLEIGNKCHKMFFDNNSQCEICPLKDGQSRTMEYYNGKLKMWLIVDSSEIKWDNEDAYLLVCKDITKYKK